MRLHPGSDRDVLIIFTILTFWIFMILRAMMLLATVGSFFFGPDWDTIYFLISVWAGHSEARHSQWSRPLANIKITTALTAISDYSMLDQLMIRHWLPNEEQSPQVGLKSNSVMNRYQPISVTGLRNSPLTSINQHQVTTLKNCGILQLSQHQSSSGHTSFHQMVPHRHFGEPVPSYHQTSKDIFM